MAGKREEKFIIHHDVIL